MDVLLLGVSCFLYLVGVELEKVGDDFGFGRVGRKAVGGKHGLGGGGLCPCRRAADNSSVGKWHFVWQLATGWKVMRDVTI